MKKGRRIMQRLLTTLLCLALCAADIVPAGITVLAQEQEVQPNQEETDTAGKEDQTNEEEIEAEEPAENEPAEDEPPVKEDEEETAPPVEEEQEAGSEEEQESVSENTTEEEQDTVSEDTADEEANVNSVMTASEGSIASGTSNDISWEIDANGKLTVTGNGDWENKTFDSHRWTPWYEHRESIKTAEIDVRNMTDASYMFFGCENLTGINLTSSDSYSSYSLNNMASMFYGCTSLTEVNFNNFYSDNVTDMSSMFFGCESLETLNLSNFRCHNVKNMASMFSGCRSLTTLDDLSNFSSVSVTDMSEMFYGCESLTNLEAGSLLSNSVTSTRDMFAGCTALTHLDLGSGLLSRSCVTDMSGMFQGCSALYSLKLPRLRSDSLEDMSRMFSGCRSLSELNLNNFYTDHVTNMKNMFSGCGLEKLDLSNLSTDSVTDPDLMFDFNDCGATVIYTPRNLKHSVKLPGGAWYRSDGTTLTELELPKNLNYSIALKKNETPENIAAGTSGNVSWVIDANGKLILSGTGDLERKYDFDLPWGKHYDSIKTAEVTVTDMTDASYLFYGCSYLTSIDLTNFDTAKVTDMSYMFYGCEWLENLDLRKFDTGSVTDMSYMFHQCYKLTTLDFSNFDTSKVTDMEGMFSRCNMLVSLKNISVFHTDNVTNMSGMFHECRNLPELDLSNFKTGSVEDMSDMFFNCNGLTTLNIISFDTSKVTDMSGMFGQCYELTSLKLNHFDTGSVKDMSSMFSNCKNLRTLDVINFNTSSVKDMSWMFNNCANLTSLDLSKFNTSGVTDMHDMFNLCANLTTLDVSKFNTSNVTNMRSMFWGCENLTKLDLNSFDIGSVTDMSSMFYKCAKLTTLDLSNFDADSVTNMGGGVFSFCSNLTTIYTPRNVKSSVNLPSEPGDIWYRSDGTEVTQLPRNLSYSVALGRNYKPTDPEKPEEPKDPDDPEEPKDPNDPEEPKDPNAPSDDDPKDNNDEGIDDKDIPEGGKIPNGLWISAIEDQTYTGTAIEPEVRVYDGGKRLKEGSDYTLKYKNNTNAAKFDDAKPPMIEVKSKGNYSGTETKTFTITKRDISDTCVTKDFANAYVPLANGKNPNLVFTAKCNNKALKKNTDYALTVKDSTGKEVTSYGAVGTYTAVVKGAGNYTGEYNFPFEVSDKIPVSKLKIGKIATVNYDGTSKTPEPVITYGKVTLNKGTDYTLNYLNNTDVGTAMIIITGMGDYFGTRNVTFSIAGLQIKNAKFTGFVKSSPYMGGEVRQTTAVLKYGDEELKEGKDYTVSYSKHQNKGKAAVTYTGIGKYTGTLKKTYSITAYNIAADTQKRIKLSTDEISAAYAKGGARPSLKVYDGTRLLTEGTDYTLSYQNNAAVTTSATAKQPTITVKGKGNYAGTFSEKKTFTITTKNIAEVTVTAPDVAASTTIGKYKSTPVLTDSNGKNLKAGTDYDNYTYTYKSTTEKVLNDGAEVTRNGGDSVDAKDIVPANTVLCVRIKAKEGSNYTGEKTVEYRIVTSLVNKAKITVKNPAQNNSNLFPYTGQAIRLEKSNLIVKVGTEVLSDDQYEILEDTYKNNVGKGTASVQIKGVGNYGGTATVKFKIGTKGFQWMKRLFG